MADIFYFNSPHATQLIRGWRRKPRNPVSLGNRRRPGIMDGFQPQACMAQVEEPTFCPSNCSALLPQPPLSPWTQSASEYLCQTEDSSSVHDGDEDGGVRLNLAALQESEGNATDSPVLLQSPIQAPRASHAVDSSFAEHSYNQHHRSITNLLRTRHPRPHTQEVWDEENSRRLRFALEGIDTSEVPRFAMPSGNAELTTRTRLEDAAVSTLDQLSVTHVSSHTAEPVEPSRLGHFIRDSNGLDAPNDDPDPSDNVASHMDEDDWLAVDDARRDYDFAGFMDRWRLQSMFDKSMSPFEIGIQPSIRLWKPPEHLNRCDVSSERDMQAIRWRLIGPSRDQAQAARTQLHPSRCVVDGSGVSAALSRDATVTVESAYRFRGFTPSHRAQTCHYQLRNMLAAYNRASIFYASGSKVFKTSLACPSSLSTLMDLTKPATSAASFKITCLATQSRSSFGDQFILAGGFYGEFALLNTRSLASEPVEGFVTHAYNGLVTHIHTFANRRSGVPLAAFCSNDRQLRIMDLGTARFTHSFSHAHSINCAATAPDGRLRVIVGDCHDAHITDAEKGETLVTLPGHTDHGFACAWADDGIHVATGAQDRNTMVWDARNWSKPLQSLPSIRSCPRSLHFTDNGALLVAESDDIVSIYDAATFNKLQDICFFGAVAGLALLDGGTEMVIANADKTIGGLMSFKRTPDSCHNEREIEGRHRAADTWNLGQPSQAFLNADVFI
jgi:hypothetical protein